MIEEKTSLFLSSENWWEELGESGLPNELKSTMRALVSATLHSRILPPATDDLIALAKKHLLGTIQIGNIDYRLVVFVPSGEDKEKRRQFFTLVRKWPGGQLRRLEEL